jgi:hypothetical protein
MARLSADEVTERLDGATGAATSSRRPRLTGCSDGQVGW